MKWTSPIFIHFKRPVVKISKNLFFSGEKIQAKDDNIKLAFLETEEIHPKNVAIRNSGIF